MTMVPNKDPELSEQLKRIWRESAERQKQRQAVQASLQYIDLLEAPIELEALKCIPEEKARKANIAAFEKRGNMLAVAIFNQREPLVQEVLKELNEKGLQAKTFLVSQESLSYAWSFYSFVPKETKSVSSRVDIAPLTVGKFQKELTTLTSVKERLDELIKNNATPGELVEVMLAGALTSEASDIHFEPTDTHAGIRYRIDGELKDFGVVIPKEQYAYVVSRIKLLSNMRLNVTKAAQDGRFTIGLGELEVEIRVSVIPSEFGETIVLRVLDPRIIQLTIADLGMREDDRRIVEAQLKSPNGMILNTGPTGSGKTTTLYAFLRNVSTTTNKVITIEDPIEYHLQTIEQTQVDEKAGYTFSNGLQSIMRQDPDVILIGEIRDKETVAIAVQAALTGHLVFSTLHTNSAAGVVPRLLDLGAPVTSIGPALNLIIAQRLVRKLCTYCKVKSAPSAERDAKIAEFIKNLPARVGATYTAATQVYEPPQKDGITGCEKCNFSGYKGRIGIFELLEVGEEMEPIINTAASEGIIAKFAREHGFVSLQQDGILKVLQGVTSFSEVESVTGELKEIK